jgi:hypothetical protein
MTIELVNSLAQLLAPPCHGGGSFWYAVDVGRTGGADFEMKALKIVGVVVVAIWMAWMSVQILRLNAEVTETCAIAYGRNIQPDGGLKVPVVCPALEFNEIRKQNPK